MVDCAYMALNVWEYGAEQIKPLADTSLGLPLAYRVAPGSDGRVATVRLWWT